MHLRWTLTEAVLSPFRLALRSLLTSLDETFGGSRSAESHYTILTLKMEEHVGAVILEHLGDQLDVHVLDVDFLPLSDDSTFNAYLKTPIKHQDCLVELLLRGQFCLHWRMTPTTLVIIRDKSTPCCCSWGLS